MNAPVATVDDLAGWSWFAGAPTPAGTWHVYAPDLDKDDSMTSTSPPVTTGPGPWLVTCSHVAEDGRHTVSIRCTTAADVDNVVRALVNAGLSPHVRSL
ncbi:hypothetical protein EAH68_05295 [Corynebacterium hylobatis]|uniref:Uncharacterized protein n=1 Tax=Corynebacterium hylobatis TaxID=1859290 RepID=A0A430I0A2_9CORY|nr:hypothetical protein [Corynebacterium hylobatis]RSZ64409.1 hypothetical protein EAH68_05295 [Corynebacterium hylobatis]